MQARTLSVVQAIYKWSFLACLAVLPMSHTTALRNLLLFVMLLLLSGFAVVHRKELPALMRSARPIIPWPLLVWCAFLLLFPLWAVYPAEAWANLRGQWMGSVIAWGVGFGAIWILGRKGPGLWGLALASAFPLALHLLSFLAVWLGLLGTDVPASMSFGEVWTRLERNVNAAPTALVDITSLFFSYREGFPQGFWGVEPMHGNLGYAACQAIVLFSVLMLCFREGRGRYQALAALMAIILCWVSILIASSRGAILYAAAVLLLAGMVHLYRRILVWRVTHRSRSWQLGLVLGLLASAGLVAALAFGIYSKDPRWQTMADKVRIGLSLPSPERVLCDGISPEIEAQIRQEFSHRDPAYINDLLYGLRMQDGGRILLMRVGIGLVLENPRGLDGARSSYKRLIEAKCGHEPVLTFAHLHQSWMDIALALGWLGAGLFAWLLLFFARTGWRSLGVGAAGPWGFALLLVASFWFLRGFADSLYREHYLQMQAMLMAYLYGRMFLTPVKVAPDDGR